MDALPPNAQLYLPVLVQVIKEVWPELQTKYVKYIAAQPEQETCPSLKSPRCWNPKTENINPKNNGEYGWGLGQMTNTNKFNLFQEATTKYSGLKGWKWENRFDPTYQLKAMAYQDRTNYNVFKNASDDNKLAFAFSAYNGGLGGVLNDRKYCANVPGCDKEVWFGNVETHSLKARMNLKGYSISAYQINRDYVHNIWYVRPQKYEAIVNSLMAK